MEDKKRQDKILEILVSMGVNISKFHVRVTSEPTLLKIDNAPIIPISEILVEFFKKNTDELIYGFKIDSSNFDEKLNEKLEKAKNTLKEFSN